MKHPFTKARQGNKKSKPAVVTAKVAGAPNKLSFGQTVAILLLAGIGLLAASGYYWYQNVFTDPNRVMNDVLDKSLQTSSVYRKVEQKGNQNSVQQSLYLSFSPQTVARSITDLKEQGSTGNSAVTTETIGTKDTDYVRYADIDVSSANGPALDFSNVLNTWGKRQNSQESPQPVSFLNDALFVAVPFGNLNPSQRQQLKEEIRSVNLYETTKTETGMIDGRPVMSYTIDIKPQALVQVLAKYVTLTGVGSPASLDPAQYEGAPKTEVIIKVDLLSRHVKQVEFAGSGRTETYGSYNLASNVRLPEKTVNIDELQARLSEIEKKHQQSRVAFVGRNYLPG